MAVYAVKSNSARFHVCILSIKTMGYENTLQHDEINLARLVRRIEKSVANEDEWKPRASEPGQEVWLRAQKALQVISIETISTSQAHTTAPRISNMPADW